MMRNNNIMRVVTLLIVLSLASPAYAYDWDDFTDFDRWGWCWTFWNCVDGGHTYNIVLYQGSYRIMDYGPIGDFFYSNIHSESHATDNIWNDRVGKHWEYNDRAKTYAYNYPNGTACPQGGWSDKTYYIDVCRGSGTNTGTDSSEDGMDIA